MSARILVVDDVPANVKLLEAKLGREYYEVQGAFSGSEALDLVRSQAFDIILLDVMMPGMDGFEVCRQLKADPATQHIPVVMVTALSDTADRVRGLESGADDFLTKPVEDIALFARVRSLARLKMMLDEWLARERTSQELGTGEGAALEADFDPSAARILVVEDSPVDQEKILETLRLDYDDVSVATGIDEGHALAKANDYELVAISLTLDGQDGLRLCSHLRSDVATRQTPILLLSDEGDMKRVAKGLDLGANDYLLKPIDRNEMLARVRSQVRRKRFQDRLRASIDQGLSMALSDSLTGLFNRRYLMRHLNRMLDRLRETGRPLSVILFDIDYFKSVNDTWGHGVGDVVLRTLADTVKGCLRGKDSVARYGGEEFVVITPDTPLEAAAQVAERIRQRVEDTAFTADSLPHPLKVTISMGVATTLDPTLPAEELLRQADEALYTAKRSGRNQVRLADERPVDGTPA